MDAVSVLRKAVVEHRSRGTRTPGLVDVLDVDERALRAYHDGFADALERVIVVIG